MLSRLGNKIQLTAKPTLVNLSENEIVSSYDSISELGMKVTGFVTKVNQGESSSIVITLFGNVYGQCVVDPDENYCVGQVVQAYVSCVRPLSFSMNQSTSSSLEAGQIVRFDRVLQRVENDLVVSLDGGNRALLPIAHLSDRRVSSSSLDSYLALCKDIMVLRRFSNLKKHHGCQYLVTAKQSMIQSRDVLIETNMEENDVLNGFVEGVSGRGLYVHFLNGASGFVERKEVSTFDGDVDPRELYKRGDSVRVRVLVSEEDDEDEEEKPLSLTIRGAADEQDKVYVTIGRTLEEENTPEHLEIGTWSLCISIMLLTSSHTLYLEVLSNTL